MAKFTCAGQTFDNQEDFIWRGHRCATPNLSRYDISSVDRDIATFRERNAAYRQIKEVTTINVHFVHITDGPRGTISEQQRKDQIDVLNEGFSPHRIEFFYDESAVVHVDHARWYRMGHNSPAERDAKAALQVDPTRNLNFYTAGIQDGLLGWATFPAWLRGDPVLDGVVMLDETLPGGSASPYNLGRTGTHEIGHWLGLFHTFQGGCNGFGDQVGDTVAHSAPNFGTPADNQPHNACISTQLAPVRNFMNYTDDVWMTHFTTEQGQRMRDQIGTYRAGLLDASSQLRRAHVAIALAA